MLRVGVVGVRFGAQVHVPAFRLDGRTEVCALAGRDRARTAAAAAALGIPRAFGDWRALLDEGEIDAISIAVPPVEQEAIVVEAARRGKHVFCEKPLGASGAAAERMVQAVRDAGVVHAIDFMFPEIPAWQATRRLIADGAIGVLKHFFYTWRVETYASRTNADSWKNRHGDGGGVVGNFLPHVLFNVEWLLGPLARVERAPGGDARRLVTSFDGRASLQDDVDGIISISTDSFLGSGHVIEIHGSAGTIVLRNQTADYASGFEVQLGTRDGGVLAVVTPAATADGRDGRIPPVSRIVRRLVDGIELGSPVSPNLCDGLRTQRWLDGVMETGVR